MYLWILCSLPILFSVHTVDKKVLFASLLYILFKKKLTMHCNRRSNDAVQFYLNEMCARVVAKSGIPSDRFHLGKLILQALRDDPDLVLQVRTGFFNRPFRPRTRGGILREALASIMFLDHNSRSALSICGMLTRQ